MDVSRNLIQDILNAVPDADPVQVMLVLPTIGTLLARDVASVSSLLVPMEMQADFAAKRVRALCGSPPEPSQWDRHLERCGYVG